MKTEKLVPLAPLARQRHAARITDADWLVSRHIARDVARAARMFASGALLDVGCGGRPYEAALRPHVERYIGLDTPASTLSLADVRGDAARLPFRDSSFDTVLCSQVLEHLPEPWEALTEIGRILRPGGHIILTAPQFFNLHEEPFDYYRYTRFGLASLCERSGLEVVEIRAQAGAWASIGLTLTIHLGSYARELSRTLTARRKRARMGPDSSSWQHWFWILRLPIVVTNATFALLDALPSPGLFPVNWIAVARRPGRGAPA